MAIEILVFFYIFIMGLIFGSFYNVVILRPFSNESIVSPPSKCPKCNHKLAWYDNIPLISYIILGAKCRYCKAPIHWQYPLVEFITGVLFLGIYFKFGLTLEALFMAIAMSFFVIMSATDFKEQVVFNMHTYPFIASGIIYGLVSGHIIDSLWGLLLGILIMEVAARTGYLFVGKRAFGEGDTYIAAGIGAYLGVKGIIATIVMAVLIQTLWAFPVLLKKYYDNKKYSEILTVFVFIFIIASFCFIDKLGGFSTLWIYLTFVLLMFSYAYKVCRELIHSTQLEGGGLYLPFGPALFVAATIIIFFLKDLIGTLITNIL